MLVYADASALAKLFLEEVGSREAAAMWDAAAAVVTSTVARTETLSALAVAHRAGRLDRNQLRRAQRAWIVYRDALTFVELTRGVADEAGSLANLHALGALDAIHLASALTVMGADTVVATWDRRLHHAAQRVGLPTLPVAL